MSGRIKIKPKNKDKKPDIDVFKIIENRFKNMNELRDLIDRDLNAAINIQAVGVDAAIRTQSSRAAGCVEASKME